MPGCTRTDPPRLEQPHHHEDRRRQAKPSSTKLARETRVAAVAAGISWLRLRRSPALIDGLPLPWRCCLRVDGVISYTES